MDACRGSGETNKDLTTNLPKKLGGVQSPVRKVWRSVSKRRKELEKKLGGGMRLYGKYVRKKN